MKLGEMHYNVENGNVRKHNFWLREGWEGCARFAGLRHTKGNSVANSEKRNRCQEMTSNINGFL